MSLAVTRSRHNGGFKSLGLLLLTVLALTLALIQIVLTLGLVPLLIVLALGLAPLLIVLALVEPHRM